MDKPRRYQCAACGHLYDPEQGDPDSGIPPGTPFEEIIESWGCPDCQAAKREFHPVDG